MHAVPQRGKTPADVARLGQTRAARAVALHALRPGEVRERELAFLRELLGKSLLGKSSLPAHVEGDDGVRPRRGRVQALVCLLAAFPRRGEQLRDAGPRVPLGRQELHLERRADRII